eukprot:1069529-Amphidinium_carterae.1
MPRRHSKRFRTLWFYGFGTRGLGMGKTLAVRLLRHLALGQLAFAEGPFHDFQELVFMVKEGIILLNTSRQGLQPEE